MSWPPSSYDETYKLVASVAILGAGVWGALTWWRQERLRKEKEEPGFECSMECSQSALPDGDVLLSIDVVTMNTGVLPLRPATKQASISIKAVNSPTSETFIEEEVDALNTRTICRALVLSYALHDNGTWREHRAWVRVGQLEPHAGAFTGTGWGGGRLCQRRQRAEPQACSQC